MLVLVIDEGQADGHESLVQVCREYDVDGVDGLAGEIDTAATVLMGVVRPAV